MARKLRELLKEKRRLESEAAAIRADLQRVSKLRAQGSKARPAFDRAAAAGLNWANRLTEIAHQFSEDPAAGLKDRRSREALRTFEHPYRYWYLLLSSGNREKLVQARPRERPNISPERLRKLLDLDLFENQEKRLIERQQIPFWADLRQQLLHLHLPSRLENRFADLLTGYLLVLELQTEQRGKSWRAFKRSSTLKEAGITPSMTITATPSHQEHLQTRILVLMAEDLAKRGWSQKRDIYLRFVIPAWQLIGIKIENDESLLRYVRRSRRKAKLP